MVLTRQFRGTLVAYREDSLDCTNCLVMLSGILDKHSFRWSSRLAHAEGMGGGGGVYLGGGRGGDRKTTLLNPSPLDLTRIRFFAYKKN